MHLSYDGLKATGSKQQTHKQHLKGELSAFVNMSILLVQKFNGIISFFFLSNKLLQPFLKLQKKIATVFLNISQFSNY